MDAAVDRKVMVVRSADMVDHKVSVARSAVIVIVATVDMEVPGMTGI